MASLIWLDEGEWSFLFNHYIDDDHKSIITRKRTTGSADRYIIAKGNVLEGREGK